MPETFAEGLARLQAQHFRSLANLFAGFDENDKDGLVVLMRATFRFTDITPAQMGDALGLSAKTPERWAAGHVGPHPIIGRITRDWLVNELRQRADMIEAFPGELGTPEDDYIPRRYLPPQESQPRA